MAARERRAQEFMNRMADGVLKDMDDAQKREDMMIARTGEGGEPHLLLRHSSCSTDVLPLPIEQEEEECNLDDKTHLTPFYETALEKYGPHLSRSLVDRAFSSSNPDEQYLDLKSILQQLYGIFVRPNH